MTRSTPVTSRALGILSGARSVADGPAIPLGCFGQCNPKALGLPIAAWLRIRPVPGQLQKVAEILQGLPEIVECDRITGEDCFIARAQIQSVEALEKLIDQVIPYAMTNISIIQSSPVKRRLPAILRGERTKPTKPTARSKQAV